MPRDKSSAKNIMDIKGEDEPQKPKPTATQMQIDPGNVSVLTVRLLDAINQNLVTIVKQNEKLLEKFDHIEGE